MPARSPISARPPGRPPIVYMRRLDTAALPLTVYRRDGTRTVHSPELHGHRFFVLFFADGGTGTIRFIDKEMTVTPGHIHLLAPGELHDTSALASVTGWAAEFTEELLGGPVGGVEASLPRAGHTHWLGFSRRASAGPAHGMVPEIDRGRWNMRFERIESELREARLGYREAARAHLHILLIEAARVIAPLAAGDALPALVSEAFDFIEQRYADPISLADVARAVGRSGSHLTSVIRKHTGMTVLEWIQERRLAEARRRLRETDEDIAIVADRVGFSDATYFIRQFRRAHQMTPREWRLAHRVARDR